ncbi:PREDICTED: uncharacterized protein LOC106545019 [Thamnophis sirtalis]|uniref:Uncharacterized protein LOC106545019 n=1 Tax=Thamnophis sirtalis TaxID=35019 RepID=A0A6I9XT52_9SAUR|nr:PREDICTED: uncharacterized protein LOC106545019 [Thamnophis sirtalis]
MADIIAAAIERGIAAGLQHHTAVPSTSQAAHSSKKAKPSRAQGAPNDSLSQVSEVEEQVSRDSDLSDDEDLMPAPSSLEGLFKPVLFRSLLLKAKKVSGIPAAKPSVTMEQDKTDMTDPLFSRPIVEKDVVPSPKLFLEVFQIMVVSAPNAATAASEDALHPEDKRFDQTLVKGYQASAWALQASSSASFFNRAALRWLKQLQERLPPSDTRTHKDLNRLKAAMEYSADASLDAARFVPRP